MLLLKADTEQTDNHEAVRALSSAHWPLGPPPQEPSKEACGRGRTQQASDNFVKGRCD